MSEYSYLQALFVILVEHPDLADRPFELWFDVQQTPYIEMILDWSSSTGIFQREPQSRDRIVRRLDFDNKRARATIFEGETMVSDSYLNADRMVDYDANADRTTTDDETSFDEHTPEILGVGTEELLFVS